MKIVISHDVDHLFWREHWLRDAFIPKYLLRNWCLFCSGTLSCSLWRRRVSAPFRGKTMHNIDALLSLDRRHGIQPTFFIGVSKALGMSYTMRQAERIVTRLKQQKCDIGGHGTAFASCRAIHQEHAVFVSMLPDGTPFGVRNHYLRRVDQTLNWQSAAGYSFDSSVPAVASPYHSCGIWEFPVCLMDSLVVPEGDRQDIASAIARTEQVVTEADVTGVSHFTICTHDVYFSHLYPSHRAWYTHLLGWLGERFEFVSFRDALTDFAAATSDEQGDSKEFTA